MRVMETSEAEDAQSLGHGSDFGSPSVILGVNDLQLSLCLVGELEHFAPRGQDFLLFPTHLIYAPTD